MLVLGTVREVSVVFLHVLYVQVCDRAFVKFVVLLAGFGANSAPSGFGTNFGLGAGATAFGQTQCRPATSGTTPFSMCEVQCYSVHLVHLDFLLLYVSKSKCTVREV